MGTSAETAAGPGRATVFMPHYPANILWGAASHQLCLMIPARTLVEELEQMLGRSVSGSLTFEAEMDLTTPTARGWRASLEVLRTDLMEGPGCWPRCVWPGRWNAWWSTASSSDSSTVTATPWTGERGTPRRARCCGHDKLLEEQPEEAWSTSALAVRVHVSVRSLQEGFARDHGVPPMRYLQQVRLRRARDLLREGSSTETTVLRWPPDSGCPIWDASLPTIGARSASFLGDLAARLTRVRSRVVRRMDCSARSADSLRPSAVVGSVRLVSPRSRKGREPRSPDPAVAE